MAVKVRGVYENGVVYLNEPLPAEFPADERQEVEVMLEVAAPYAVLESSALPVDDETAILAEMDRLNAELRALGDPADDTPTERERRVEIFDLFFDLMPPLTDKMSATLKEAIHRPISMFQQEEYGYPARIGR
jgi:hypothetical protein